MKKLIMPLFVLVTVIGFGVVSIFAEDTSEEVTTNTSVSFNYTDYYDLVEQIENQIYLDLYDQIYDDVYQDFVNQIDSDLYDQIYQQIESDLIEQFETLSLYRDATQLEIYAVVEIANQSVVGIETWMGSTSVSLGSAVIYRYDEIEELFYIITNHHVIDDGDNYKIRFEDETKVDATLLGYDEAADIAILSFSSIGLEGFVPAVLGSSSDLEKGQIILAAGHPRGFNFFNSITFGVVAGLDRKVSDESITYVQHDAAINSGNSGGPIFNLKGEVVGINVLKLAHEEIEGMGFSIPIDLVIEFIENNIES